MTTILVVDNSPVNIELLRSIFEPFGYEILAAQNIRQGLRLAREAGPDLILSDLHMPGGDGFDFIREVKADPELNSIPFLFISSTVWRDKDRVDGLALGAERFIIRPIEPRDLLREVEACLNG
jgi:two-component system, cell cycle response regulator